MTLDLVRGAALVLVRLVDESPEPDDVTAGTWGAVMFGLLVVATIILMRSFLKQMRKTEQAKRAGVYGDDPADPDDPDDRAPDASRASPANDETTPHQG